MNPRATYLLQRKCWRKSGAYKTSKAARRRARQIYRKSGLQLYSYGCTGCGEYHLTKQQTAKGRIL